MCFTARLRIKDLCPNGLRDYLAGLQRRGLSQWTVLKYYGYAKRICEWAVDQGWLVEMPRRPPKKDLRPPPSVPRDYSHTDLTAVFANLPQRAFRPLYFILETGCRPGEARNLRWEQVDLENAICVLRHHKTATSGLARTLTLTTNAIELLREIGPKRSGWVFPSSRTGEPYTKSGLYAILRRAGLEHGVTSIYGLRHTRAQAMLDQGIGIGTVAEWLGHRDLRTVQIYAQIRQRHLRKAAEALPPIVQRLPLVALPAKEDGTGPAKPRRRPPARRGSSPRKPATASMEKGKRRSAI
jgi:integrase